MVHFGNHQHLHWGMQVLLNTERHYVELPYTLPQDSTLFLVLREPNNDIWKHKLDWIAMNGGMALVITHPDYMNFDGKSTRTEYPARLYEDFLLYALERWRADAWIATCREVAQHAAPALLGLGSARAVSVSASAADSTWNSSKSIP
jgi:hypothetical protein